MKMAKFQTLWIQMRKKKPLDESRKTDQTSGTGDENGVLLNIKITTFKIKQINIEITCLFRAFSSLEKADSFVPVKKAWTVQCLISYKK
ncbi:hypothetical protein Hanom_Chr04g00374171 [Helianthus anomalus]